MFAFAAGEAAASSPGAVVVPLRFPGEHTTWHSGLPVHWTAGAPAARVANHFSLQLKRCLDLAMALIGLLLLLPVLLGAALAIKLTSRGPIFFPQPRVGLHGQKFTILKFRTMHVECSDRSGIEQTRADDQRLTRLGRFLRRTSIDELPQLLNVLKGEMSIVGPRPHVEGMLAAGRDYRDLVVHHDYRLLVRPGISGWAQANGYRGQTIEAQTAIERIHHDFAYVQNRSTLLDLRIILMTLRREFLSGSGI